MLIGKVDRGSGYRQGQHGRGKRHTSPLHPLVIEERSRDAPACRKDQGDRSELEEQFGGGDRDVRVAHKACHPAIEEGGLQLDAEKG